MGYSICTEHAFLKTSIHFPMWNADSDLFSQKQGNEHCDEPFGQSGFEESDNFLDDTFEHGFFAISDQPAPGSNVGGDDIGSPIGFEGDHLYGLESNLFDGFGDTYGVDDVMGGDTGCQSDWNSGTMPVLWGGNLNLSAGPPADDGQKKPQEKKKGDYPNANYNWRLSPAYQALIDVGNVYRKARLRNDEIAKLVRAFRPVHVPHDQELGRAVRYLPQIAAWLDKYWDDIGGKFLEFAHQWCSKNLRCQNK